MSQPSNTAQKDRSVISHRHLSKSLLLHTGSQERLGNRSPLFWMLVLDYVADWNHQEGKGLESGSPATPARERYLICSHIRGTDSVIDMEGATDPCSATEDNLSSILLGPKGGAGPPRFQEGVIPIIRRFEHITLLLHHVSTSSLPPSLDFPSPIASFLPRVLAVPGEAAWLSWKNFWFCVVFKTLSLWLWTFLQNRAWMSYNFWGVLPEADPGVRFRVQEILLGKWP